MVARSGGSEGLLTTASHQECLVARDSSSDRPLYFFFSIRTPTISDHHPQSNNASRDILIHSYFLDGIKRISGRLSRDLKRIQALTTPTGSAFATQIRR